MIASPARSVAPGNCQLPRHCGSAAAAHTVASTRNMRSHKDSRITRVGNIYLRELGPSRWLDAGRASVRGINRNRSGPAASALRQLRLRVRNRTSRGRGTREVVVGRAAYAVQSIHDAAATAVWPPTGSPQHETHESITLAMPSSRRGGKACKQCNRTPAALPHTEGCIRASARRQHAVTLRANLRFRIGDAFSARRWRSPPQPPRRSPPPRRSATAPCP